VGFGRFSPAEGESALAVRRPRAVIVADDNLSFAVAKCDGRWSQRILPNVARSQSTTQNLWLRSGTFLIAHFWLPETARQRWEQAFCAGVPRMLRRSHKCHGPPGDLISFSQDREIVSIRVPLPSVWCRWPGRWQSCDPPKLCQDAAQHSVARRQRVTVVLDGLGQEIEEPGRDEN
jgi:hypothetical protein